MLLGEPHLDVCKTEVGMLIVEIRGVDVYDPTTGEIRSSSTDDIACWFVDTIYNGESFFVHHAYFTGADSRMKSSSVRYKLRSMKPPGSRSTPPSAGHSSRQRAARSR